MRKIERLKPKSTLSLWKIVNIVKDGGHWGESSWESQGKQANKQMDKGSVHV
jgi:hypothetical protein